MLFGKFLHRKHICIKFIKYVKLKARYNFDILKAFITMLVISGYADLLNSPCFGRMLPMHTSSLIFRRFDIELSHRKFVDILSIMRGKYTRKELDQFDDDNSTLIDS